MQERRRPLCDEHFFAKNVLVCSSMHPTTEGCSPVEGEFYVSDIFTLYGSSPLGCNNRVSIYSSCMVPLGLLQLTLHIVYRFLMYF